LIPLASHRPDSIDAVEEAQHALGEQAGRTARMFYVGLDYRTLPPRADENE
jgi:hypothetical protein